jgi:hypothetical protein
MSTTLRPASTRSTTRRRNSASAFRRLQQKTQVFPLSKNAAVRSRLTHSVEVSDVGRLIASALARSYLAPLGPDVTDSIVLMVETGCLMPQSRGMTGAGGGECLESEGGKEACGAKIPWIRHDEESLGVQRSEALTAADPSTRSHFLSLTVIPSAYRPQQIVTMED